METYNLKPIRKKLKDHGYTITGIGDTDLNNLKSVDAVWIKERRIFRKSPAVATFHFSDKITEAYTQTKAGWVLEMRYDDELAGILLLALSLALIFEKELTVISSNHTKVCTYYAR